MPRYIVMCPRGHEKKVHKSKGSRWPRPFLCPVCGAECTAPAANHAMPEEAPDDDS